MPSDQRREPELLALRRDGVGDLELLGAPESGVLTAAWFRAALPGSRWMDVPVSAVEDVIAAGTAKQALLVIRRAKRWSPK